MFVFFTGKEP